MAAQATRRNSGLTPSVACHPDDELAEVAHFQEPDENLRRIFQAVDDVLTITQLPSREPFPTSS